MYNSLLILIIFIIIIIKDFNIRYLKIKVNNKAIKDKRRRENTILVIILIIFIRLLL